MTMATAESGMAATAHIASEESKLRYPMCCTSVSLRNIQIQGPLASQAVPLTTARYYFTFLISDQ